MHRFSMRPVALALLCAGASADPIHGRPDGSYWHHDSGWVFAEKLGEFTRVGVPQDVAGSRDAIAYYARVVDGVQTVASIDVIAPDSAAEDATPEAARKLLESRLPPDAERVTGDTRGGRIAAPRGTTRLAYLVPRDGARELWAIAEVPAGEWRVRIRVTVPRADARALADVDDLVRDQLRAARAICEASAASSAASCAASAGAASSP